MSLPLQLNKKITIQQRSGGEDAAGQPVDVWTDVATVWASVDAISGREYFASQANQAEVQTRIRIRLRNGILPAMRVVYGSTIYDINAVLPQSRELHLMCSSAQ